VYVYIVAVYMTVCVCVFIRVLGAVKDRRPSCQRGRTAGM